MRTSLSIALLALLGSAAGCGDGGIDTPDTGTSMDAGVGSDSSAGPDSARADAAAVDSAVVDSGADDGGVVESDSGTDAGAVRIDAGGAPMCGGTMAGWCDPGVDCLSCPATPLTDQYFCTTTCMADTDCTDPSRPTCSRDMFRPGPSVGICVPPGTMCRWGVVCASPTTPIATPFGERPIADLVVGDLVYGEDHGALRAVPIREIVRTPVLDHRVVRVELATGRMLEISPGHPTADGRFFADLRSGDTLDGIRVVSAELVPYVHAFTHDILPDSDTGTYVAGGALIGSTLAR